MSGTLPSLFFSGDFQPKGEKHSKRVPNWWPMRGPKRVSLTPPLSKPECFSKALETATSAFELVSWRKMLTIPQGKLIAEPPPCAGLHVWGLTGFIYDTGPDLACGSQIAGSELWASRGNSGEKPTRDQCERGRCTLSLAGLFIYQSMARRCFHSHDLVPGCLRKESVKEGLSLTGWGELVYWFHLDACLLTHILRILLYFCLVAECRMVELKVYLRHWFLCTVAYNKV